MERRTLLKAITALPALAVDGVANARAYKLEPAARYIVLVDPESIDVDDFCTHPSLSLPPGTPVYCVRPGTSIDEALRIYKVED